MSEWQPVDTAPEGRCVLMWVDERMHERREGAVVGYVRNEYGVQFGYSVETGRALHRVTHWKPIEAPREEAAPAVGCIPVVSTEPDDADN